MAKTSILGVIVKQECAGAAVIESREIDEFSRCLLVTQVNHRLARVL